VIAGGIGTKGDTGFSGVRGVIGSVRIGWFVNNNAIHAFRIIILLSANLQLARSDQFDKVYFYLL